VSRTTCGRHIDDLEGVAAASVARASNGADLRADRVVRMPRVPLVVSSTWPGEEIVATMSTCPRVP